MIANAEAKNVKIKDEMKLLDKMLCEMNQEVDQVKQQNFELNQRLLKIAEAKENPLLSNLEKILDTKLDLLCGTLTNSLQDKFFGRRSTPTSTRAHGTSSQQGEKGYQLMFRKKYQ